jgi:hypothetical protein
VVDSRQARNDSRHTSLLEAVLSRSLASDPETTVEAWLALALERESAVGRWDVVAQLAGELQARWLAAAPLVNLDEERTRRAR